MQGGMIIASPFVVLGLIYYIRLDQWHLVILISLIYLLVVIVSFFTVGYQLRSYTIVIASLLVYYQTLMYVGVRGIAGSFLMATFSIAFMLLGLRVALGTLVIGVLLMVGVGWGVVTQTLALELLFDQLDPMIWLLEGGIPVMLAVAVGIGLIGMQREFSAVQRREQEALAKVSDERSLLEVRVEERTEELQNSNLKLEQAYQKLLTNQEALLVSEKMASLGRLTAGIAHEMNTPLAAARVSLFELDKLVDEFGQSIGDDEVSEADRQEIALEMRQIVDISTRSIERALKFIRGVKSQTRKSESAHQHFNAVGVIEDTLMLMNHTLTKNNCTISFEPSLQTVGLMGSATSFGQIVTNLITNAIDACQPGGGMITVELIKGGESIILRVSDDGVGIPKEIRSRIFDPLFTTKPFGEGTGLGLSIVHDNVTQIFNGTIDITSQVGEGTTFSIQFPVEQPHLGSA